MNTLLILRIINVKYCQLIDCQDKTYLILISEGIMALYNSTIKDSERGFRRTLG